MLGSTWRPYLVSTLAFSLASVAAFMRLGRPTPSPT
jgi:hypothetical protein